MDGGVSHVCLHLGQEILHLGCRPTQVPKDLQADSFNSPEHILLEERSHSLVVVSFGPWAQWPEEAPLDDVLEADFLEPPLVVPPVGPRPTHALRAFLDVLIPLGEGAIRRGRACEGEGEHGILHLKVATWSERVEGLAENGFGVSKAGEQGASVDVVEFLVESPRIFGVVDFEAAVGRDAGCVRVLSAKIRVPCRRVVGVGRSMVGMPELFRLDRTQICSYDLCAGKFLGYRSC